MRPPEEASGGFPSPFPNNNSGKRNYADKGDIGDGKTKE